MPSNLFIFRPTLGQGGADHVTLTLLRSLDRQTFNISLVLVKKEGALLEQLPSDITVHYLKAANILTAVWPLTQLLRRHQPHILFSTSSGTNATAVLAARAARSQARIVLSERTPLTQNNSSWKRRLQILFKRLTYAQADLITAVSQGVKTDLVSQLNLLPARITVIDNPIITPELEAKQQQPLDHPWFTNPTLPVILAVGRLVPQKDYPTLLHAFAQLRPQYPSRLLILGEGPQRPTLQRLINELDIGEWACLGGYQANPFNYMAQATLFVLSSQTEGLPGVLIQAMACGTAVVATDCHTGPAEIITQPGHNGLLTAVGDSQALATNILSLLQHPQQRAQIAHNGRLSVQRFRSQTVLQQYIHAIKGTD